MTDGRGAVVWITGLPGAGKTTIADEVARLLREAMPCVVRLDGDAVREVMDHDLGYSLDDRLRNARRLARLCKLLADQDLHVVCATVSLFRDVHAWNRANLPGYVEVYVRIGRDTFIARNQKGLVGRALRGEAGDVIGVDQAFDEPADPHLIVDNDDGGDGPARAAARIAAMVLR